MLTPFLSTEFDTQGRTSVVGFAPAIFRTGNTVVHTGVQVYQFLQHASPTAIGLLARACVYRSFFVRYLEPEMVRRVRAAREFDELSRLLWELAVVASQQPRELALAADLLNTNNATVQSLITFLGGRYPVAETALDNLLIGRGNRVDSDFFTLTLAAAVEMAEDELGATSETSDG